MILYDSISIVVIIIELHILFGSESASVALQYNSFDQSKIITGTKINMDMRQIRQKLEPLRSLFNSRDVYRKNYNMLRTLWTCCPSQRVYMFDIRDIHQTVMGRSNCHNFIRDSREHLTSQCKSNLRFFDPTRGDVDTCDGRLLRNIADKYAFTVQLSNYTKRWCTDGLYPMLIYSNITQIIQCERAIRQRLKNDPQAYFTYDALSSNLLDIYVQNINNYRDCDDPQFWDDRADEDIDLSMYIGDNCG